MSDNAFPLPGVTTISTLADWEDFFHPAFGSGVIPGVSQELVPTLDAVGRSAIIAPGAAIVRAFYKPISVSTPTPIPAASAQDRIDRLVLRLDRSQSDPSLFVTPVVITGTPGSPTQPAIQQTDDGLWDLPLARWTSAANGALKNMVDERRLLTSPTLVVVAEGVRPALERPALLIEQPTGKLWMSPTPNKWVCIYQPTDIWRSISLKANWKGTLKCTFVGQDRRFVHLSGRMTPGTDNNNTEIGVIPQAYRPAKTIQNVPLSTDYIAAEQSAHLAIHTDGSIQCWGIANAATVVSVNCTFPIDL